MRRQNVWGIKGTLIFDAEIFAILSGLALIPNFSPQFLFYFLFFKFRAILSYTILFGTLCHCATSSLFYHYFANLDELQQSRQEVCQDIPLLNYAGLLMNFDFERKKCAIAKTIVENNSITSNVLLYHKSILYPHIAFRIKKLSLLTGPLTSVAHFSRIKPISHLESPTTKSSAAITCTAGFPTENVIFVKPLKLLGNPAKIIGAAVVCVALGVKVYVATATSFVPTNPATRIVPCKAAEATPSPELAAMPK